MYGYITFVEVNFKSERGPFTGLVVHIITGDSLEEFRENIDNWIVSERYEITPFGIEDFDDIPFWFEGKSSGNSDLGDYWWGPNLNCSRLISEEIHSSYDVSAESLDSVVPVVSSDKPTEL